MIHSHATVNMLLYIFENQIDINSTGQSRQTYIKKHVCFKENIKQYCDAQSILRQLCTCAI